MPYTFYSVIIIIIFLFKCGNDIFAYILKLIFT